MYRRAAVAAATCRSPLIAGRSSPPSSLTAGPAGGGDGVTRGQGYSVKTKELPSVDHALGSRFLPCFTFLAVDSSSKHRHGRRRESFQGRLTRSCAVDASVPGGMQLHVGGARWWEGKQSLDVVGVSEFFEARRRTSVTQHYTNGFCVEAARLLHTSTFYGGGGG